MTYYHCELHSDRRQVGRSEFRSILDLGDDIEVRSVLVAMCKRFGVKPQEHKLKIREAPGGYVKRELHG